MSFVHRLVSPKLPTALADHASLDLPGYDLWLHPINIVHILPITLDIPRFEEALSRTLQLYPHAAGELRYSRGRWFIDLTNTAVPVDIDYKPNTTSDKLLDGDWVVQDDISVFLNHQCIGPFPVNSGPLLRLKLTFLDNETCIGVSWLHALGDAILLSRFMHTLSQFYQGLPQMYPSPTFQKYYFPKPSSTVLAEFWPRLPHMHITRHLSEFAEEYAKFCRDFQNLKWRVDKHDLAELRSILSSRGQNENRLSQQDCLSAYVVAVWNHTRGTPVQSILNVCSYRQICAPFIDEGMAGNQIFAIPAAVPTDIAGIATALRRALVQCRQPDYIHGAMSVVSDALFETTNAGKIVDFVDRDDLAVIVNSNTVIDWCSAHFGCPDGARFYTTDSAKQALRCFRSNPVKGEDGVWRARPSVDIMMGVLAELKPRLLETLARGIPYILDNECTQL